MKQIAVIGAGPSGLEAASVLAGAGWEVWVYESAPEPLKNITDKALLFPDFVSADAVAEELGRKLRNPRITLCAGKKVSLVPPEAPGGLWSVEGRSFDCVLLATGYQTFDAGRKEELGYGIYPGVITSLEMEDMLRRREVLNIMKEPPSRVAFLQCVGSRDEKTGNLYCSKVCCITAVKQAIEVKRLSPDTEVVVFYMDLRLWGEGFEELYRSAQQDYGVRFIRGRISEAARTFDNRIAVKAEDTLLCRPMKMSADLLVLMVGMEPSAGTRELGRLCGVCGNYGFIRSADSRLDDNRTCRQGLFVAGSCKRPMSLPEALADGRCAALEIINQFA